MTSAIRRYQFLMFFVSQLQAKVIRNFYGQYIDSGEEEIVAMRKSRHIHYKTSTISSRVCIIRNQSPIIQPKFEKRLKRS